jgi:predicted N-acetyltransferase YhbS
MPLQELKATGFEAVSMATVLLQRARRADPLMGLWEAADVQWWWHKPRLSDEVEKLFWLDDDGPVAATILTSPNEGSWQCDPIAVPHAAFSERNELWERALEHATKHCPQHFDIPVSDDDQVFAKLAQRSGLTAGHQDSTAWMTAADRPAVVAPREGFVLVDRVQSGNKPHPMKQRNEDHIAARLARCSLYDPVLDLAVETADGQVAGYSLYWFDPVTKVGLVEPVRVEDDFLRLGLATAMLSAGIDRLAAKGAQRIKVSYETPLAGALYHSVGFQTKSNTTWYQKR